MLFLLNFLRGNWQLIAIVLAVGGLYYVGYSHGEAHIQAKWDAATIEAQKVAQAEHDRLQGLADKKSKEYEELVAKQKASLALLNRRLKNEIAQNTALRECVATDEFVRIYRSTARIGDTAR